MVAFDETGGCIFLAPRVSHQGKAYLKVALAIVFALPLSVFAQIDTAVIRVSAPDVLIQKVDWSIPSPSSKPNPRRDLPRPSVYGAETPYPPPATDSPDPQYRRPSLSERASPGLLPDIGPISQPQSWGRQETPRAYLHLELENVGSKEIAAVTWEVAVSDKVGGKAYKRIEFQRMQPVVPSVTLKFSQEMRYDNGWKRLKKALEKKSAKVLVTVKAIEYADGSNWQRPK